MNSKFAKNLRQLARKVTVRQPMKGYETNHGVTRLRPSCTRWRYKLFKKSIKNGSLRRGVVEMLLEINK